MRLALANRLCCRTQRKGARGMREGWINKKLCDVCQVSAGQGAPQGEDNYSDEGIPFVKAGNLVELINGKQESDIQKVSNEVAKTHRLVLYKAGSVVFAKSGMSCMKGHVYTLKNDCYVVSHLAILQPHNISSAYLNYYLLRHKPNNLVKDEGYPSISLKDIENSTISVPNSIEQERKVVSELDKINKLIRLKKEQLIDYDKLAQSLFYEMYGDPIENEKGWEEKILSNNVQEMFLGPFGSALKVDSYVDKKDAFCMVYEQKHAIQGRLDLDNHFINEEKYNSLRRFEVKGGDFIMSCRGTIGKLYKLPNDAPKGIIHPSLMKIRIKEDVYDSTYFKYMLVKIVANERTNGNCVQMAITAKELGKKTLPLPPLSLQNLFAQRIELIEQQKAEIKNTIADLETLLASRMQYWFD